MQRAKRALECGSLLPLSEATGGIAQEAESRAPCRSWARSLQKRRQAAALQGALRALNVAERSGGTPLATTYPVLKATCSVTREHPDPDSPPNRRKTDPPGARKVTVLAVDDDQSYLHYLQRLLMRAGYEVRVAGDGLSAIDIIRSERIDLMLVDLNMPQMDGIETVRRIQADTELRHLYSILLTATTQLETKLRALNSGLDDYLSKSSTETELVAKLRSAVRRLEVERRLLIENEELQTLALTDELTGIANRRSLFREAEQMLKSGQPLSVALFDLDHFKEVNDRFGHVSGDRILAGVGKLFHEQVRFGDIVGRYGGDEFVLLCPSTTEEEARIVASRLANEICQLRWTIHGTTFGISCSYGLASATPGANEKLPDLLARCDEELYRAKERTVPCG
jgi:diguanylate cyclase (GGDEF)-like protein